MKQVRKLTPIDGVTETTVSNPIGVKYAKRATLMFERTGHSSGSVVFSIQATVDYADGGDFIPNVNMIKNSPNNHVQDLQRQITVELAANGKELYALDLEHFCYEYIQVKALESGVGTSTCKMIIVE